MLIKRIGFGTAKRAAITQIGSKPERKQFRQRKEDLPRIIDPIEFELTARHGCFERQGLSTPCRWQKASIQS